MEMLEMLMMAALVAFIGLIAVILKAEEEPKTPFNMEKLGAHVKVFVYGVIAVVIAMYISGFELMTPEGFAALLGVGYLGLSFFQAIVARAAGSEK
jgi:hypothetical protein